VREREGGREREGRRRREQERESESLWTHVGLDHLAALRSDPRDEAEHVDLPLRVHHVQHGVDHDEGARPAHAGADGRNTRNT